MPSPTIRLGFPTKDLGNTHNLNYNATITYEFCPPTSGQHFNVSGKAPLPRPLDGYYAPDANLRPGNWVHNMEHGYVVIAYKGTPTADVVASIKDVLATAAGDTFAATCGQPNRAIAVRFDDMDTPFAVLSWDRAMLLPTWDPVAAKTFIEQWQDNPSIPENPALGSLVC